MPQNVAHTPPLAVHIRWLKPPDKGDADLFPRVLLFDAVPPSLGTKLFAGSRGSSVGRPGQGLLGASREGELGPVWMSRTSVLGVEGGRDRAKARQEPCRWAERVSTSSALQYRLQTTAAPRRLWRAWRQVARGAGGAGGAGGAHQNGWHLPPCPLRASKWRSATGQTGRCKHACMHATATVLCRVNALEKCVCITRKDPLLQAH